MKGNYKDYAHLRVQDRNDEEKLNFLRHEMIKPISTISVFASLLQKEHETADSKDLSRYIDYIVREGEALKTILQVVTGPVQAFSSSTASNEQEEFDPD